MGEGGYLRVEHGLADVERRGGGGGERARTRARQRVRARLVRAPWVQALLTPLVGHEVQRLQSSTPHTYHRSSYDTSYYTNVLNHR